jgi:hypothetical protein
MPQQARIHVEVADVGERGHTAWTAILKAEFGQDCSDRQLEQIVEGLRHLDWPRPPGSSPESAFRIRVGLLPESEA